MEKLLTVSKEKKQKNNNTKLGAACGSNHELLIAKFRLKLKKVGKTTKMIQVCYKSFMLMQQRR